MNRGHPDRRHQPSCCVPTRWVRPTGSSACSPSEHGVVRAVAKGVRKPTSRFGSRLQPLNHVHVLLYTGRNLATVSAVDSVQLYGSEIAGDYVRWSAGHVLVEATERLISEEMEPARPQYRLLVSGLAALAEDHVIHGWSSTPSCCARWRPAVGRRASPTAPSAAATGPHAWIHLASGGAVCERCRPAGAVSISPGTSALLGALLSGDWAARSTRPTTSRRAASGVVAAYLQLHLERDLRSLPIADKAWLSELSVKLTSEQDVSRDRDPPPHPSGATPPPLIPDQVPRHVALVMDGNGRWAQERGLPRTAGHEAGEASLLDCVHGALELGVRWLSAYAFSTENWRRSPDEVAFLMGFNRDVIRRRRDEMNEMGVRVRWAGRRPRLWRSVIRELEIAEQMTRRATTG